MENVKTDIKEVEYEGVEWIHLAHDKEQLPVVTVTVLK
jgi:hypothetical protein